MSRRKRPLHPPMKDIQKLSKSMTYAVHGILQCLHTERNLRIHTTAAVYVTALALMARLDKIQLAVLCLCYACMMCAEMLNTAVEYLLERDGGGFDSFVRDAKDIAAGAVFIVAVFCTVIGALFFVNETAIGNIIAFVTAYPWILTVFAVSVPIAVGYIFGYFGIGRIK